MLAEPYLTETVVGCERLDEPRSPAERLIVSQRQIHSVTFPALCPSVEETTRTSYRIVIEKFLKPAVGDISLSRLA